MRPSRHFPSLDRLSVLTAVIVLAYALSRVLELPAQRFTTDFLGSALGFEINSTLFMLALVAALTSTGADTLFRAHPALSATPRVALLAHWVLPGATALVLGAALNQLPTGPSWLLGVGLATLALLAVLVAEYILLDPTDAAWEWAAFGLTLLTYGVALVLFALLRSLGARALVSGSVGGVVAALLALRLFLLQRTREAPPLPWTRLVLYAALLGLIMAETVWALSYWRLTALGAALLATGAFYLSSGLAHQHLLGRLTRRVWVEYAIIGSLTLGAAFLYALR